MTDIYTYTSDMTRPLCVECGEELDQPGNPEIPFEAICSHGHTYTYQLEESDEDRYSYRLDGEPNFAWIFYNFKEGAHTQRWFARIQLNGELTQEQQENALRCFVEALNQNN